LFDFIGSVPPALGLGVLFTSGERRRAKGEKASPLAIPGPWRSPTVGKAPGCGMSFTGREPHAIPGVTLPLAVILTAHRLQPSHHPARQTASSFGGGGWFKTESRRL